MFTNVEHCFIYHVIKLCEYGFPFNEKDFGMFEDQFNYEYHVIKRKVDPFKLTSKRDQYSIPKVDNFM